MLGSQIVTGNITLTSASPYRTIVNSASAVTVTLPAVSSSANDTRVVTNVGAGTVTVSGAFRSGTTKTIAQDNAITFAANTVLSYWTTE